MPDSTTRSPSTVIVARAGFEIEALYGDFFRAPFADDSPSMVWVARKSSERVDRRMQ